MLKYGDNLFELCNEKPSYLLPHEAHISFVSTLNIFVYLHVVFVAECNNLLWEQRARELAQLFRKQEMIKTYEKKLENQPELLEKQIPFTCLKEDRVAERYVNKAERGERLPEIEARPTAYESKVPQPRTCIPSSNEL